MSCNKLRCHGGNIKEVADQHGGREYMDFSANINPLGLAPAVREAIVQGIDDIINYPEPDAASLNRDIAAYLGVDPACVISGNGASEIIYLVTHLYKPQRVIIPTPTFSEYQLAAQAVGAEIIYYPLDQKSGFGWDVDRLLKTAARGGMLFLCNPNNPVGNLMDHEDLSVVIEACARLGTTVVVDESFRDFVTDMPTAVPLVKDFRHLIVLYSLTKFFALPGLRLGCAVAPPAMIEGLNSIRDPWSVNVLAQHAGRVAVKQHRYISQTKELIAREKDFLFQTLKSIPGLKPFSPAANYIFIDISKTGLNSKQLRTLLIKEGIIIRDCANYPGLNNYYIRMAVKTRAENQTLVNALQRLLR